jgi:hypothetical protein
MTGGKNTAGEPEEVQEQLSTAVSQSPSASQSRQPSPRRGAESVLSCRSGHSVASEHPPSPGGRPAPEGADGLAEDLPTLGASAHRGGREERGICQVAWKRLWDRLLCD